MPSKSTYFFKILLKYMEETAETAKDKNNVEEEITKILSAFSAKTGRDIKNITIEKHNNEFILLLEVQ